MSSIMNSKSIDIPVLQDVQGLIFDLDGTLVDSMPLHLVAWKEAVAAQGHDYPEYLFYEYAGIPTGKITLLINERLGWNLDPRETVRLKEEAFMTMIDRVRVIEPVFAIVEKYAGAKPMSIGTGSRRVMAQRIMEAAGLNEYFPILVAADDVERHKPEPETFLRCAELMGTAPHRCQVFEDGDAGLQAALRAGMIATDIRPYLV
ncbi:MAG: phosphatase [Spirochaetae bacterium HGW-Spirochaetae-1]|jgi:beta-phosphoglucomutase family hydrolase|nr:MAG: phosphatase [Spirochaetae bacterium HGW-Spirochaetae-1]